MNQSGKVLAYAKRDQAFVVAHFHPEGKVAIDLINLIKAISEISETIIFVSTGLRDDYASHLGNFCRVIRRENMGYDFWSYKTGIEAIKNLSTLKKLTIFNSSFITFSPQLLLKGSATEISTPRLNGLTISHQHSTHIQSYWVAFEHPDLICSDIFKKWWEGMTPISDKKEVIQKYEIGMSTYFKSHGFELDSIYKPSYYDLFAAYCNAVAVGSYRPKIEDGGITIDFEFAKNLNPNHLLWEPILKNLGIIKIDLIRNNPYRQNILRFYEYAARNEAMIKVIRDAVGSHQPYQFLEKFR
jgi:rhamnosyltransferase